MGYECPVCESVQVDAVHLANHIAFTAMIHNDEHEAWLDEHADGWSSWTEAELAETVLNHANEVSIPDLTERVDFQESALEHDHSHGHEHGGHIHNDHGHGVCTTLDQEAQEIIEEAKELTEKRRSQEE